MAPWNREVIAYVLNALGNFACCFVQNLKTLENEFCCWGGGWEVVFSYQSQFLFAGIDLDKMECSEIFQDLKPISSGQIFINLSLQIFCSEFVEGFHLLSCWGSDIMWHELQQMNAADGILTILKQTQREEIRSCVVAVFLQWLQVVGLWGAKLKNCLKVWICGFCLSTRTLVSCLSKEKARPEFQVMHILLLLDSCFLIWSDSNTVFSGKARCHWSSGCNPRAFCRCGLGDMEDPGTYLMKRQNFLKFFVCLCGGISWNTNSLLHCFPLGVIWFYLPKQPMPKSFQISWKKRLCLKIGSQQTARCRINCLFCLANLTADPWHRKWMMGKEARGRLKMASVEDGEFQCQL